MLEEKEIVPGWYEIKMPNGMAKEYRVIILRADGEWHKQVVIGSHAMVSIERIQSQGGEFLSRTKECEHEQDPMLEAILGEPAIMYSCRYCKELIKVADEASN